MRPRSLRRGAGRPWGFIPILGVGGLLYSGQQHENMTGSVGWAIGLVGLIGTNLIRLVAEKFEHSPTRTVPSCLPVAVHPET